MGVRMLYARIYNVISSYSYVWQNKIIGQQCFTAIELQSLVLAVSEIALLLGLCCT
ncbi:hypothetical protein APHNP_1232 [Anaplasma phagocytophilum str. ApNP]|uniref:Uncharacterized protein n=1 Tax=Anaplasma phagocytophilum str. ApNP TaxID=1359153 RepID=A0A0F3NGS6_ANAPH|nr:hypothetical protein APHNP_1232 [Anaplasma phagocytophilum str. ApNP]